MNEVYSLVADSQPLLIIDPKLTSFDFFDYLIVIGPIERWVAAQQNIENNANTPEITLLVVFVIQNLRGNVIGSSELLVHFLMRVKVARGTKVNYCNFWVLLIPAHKNVFRFQVPVDNFSLVAIIY